MQSTHVVPTESHVSQGELIKMVAVRLAVAIPLLFAVIFIPAGTLAYWEGWLYLAVLLIPMFFVMAYMLKKAPDLLARGSPVANGQIRSRRRRAPCSYGFTAYAPTAAAPLPVTARV